jgi:hypothetical protein
LVPVVLPPKGNAHVTAHHHRRAFLSPLVSKGAFSPGTVVLTEQLGTSSLHMASDGPTASMVRMVCGIVPAGPATAAESGALTAGRWTRVLCDGDVDAVRPPQSAD